MAKLIANVYAADEWWGPPHDRVDPPADVAEQITNPACWDEPPGAPPTAGELAEVAHHEAAATALGHEPGEDPPTEDDGPEHPDRELGFIDDHAERQAVDAEARQLEAVPLDREALLAFADAHDLDVNRKLGPVNLKAAIAKALGAR